MANISKYDKIRSTGPGRLPMVLDVPGLKDQGTEQPDPGGLRDQQDLGARSYD